MGVYLGGVELLVTEYLLESTYVYLPRLIHQGGGSVAKLVRGIVFRLKTCFLEVLFDKPLNCFGTYSLQTVAEKERFCFRGLETLGKSVCKIFGKDRAAPVVEIYDTLFVSFSYYDKAS